MDPNLTTRKPLHRGAPNDFSVFGPKFIQGRLAAFSKDMEICLRPIPARNKSGFTHAYFPALGACFGLLEYLTGLYVGKFRGLSEGDIQKYARYLPQPDYDDDMIYVLYRAFRHSVAHRGIASGVWVDPRPRPQVQRLTWKIIKSAQKPAIKFVEENKSIIRDSPWECPYTHRVHIYLGQMWKDIRASAELYSNDLAKDEQLQANFRKCMLHLYPH